MGYYCLIEGKFIIDFVVVSSSFEVNSGFQVIGQKFLKREGFDCRNSEVDQENFVVRYLVFEEVMEFKEGILKVDFIIQSQVMKD